MALIKRLDISALPPKLETITLPHINSVSRKAKAFFNNLDGVKIIDGSNDRKKSKVLRTIKSNEVVEMKFNGSRWVEVKIKYLKKSK